MPVLQDEGYGVLGVQTVQQRAPRGDPQGKSRYRYDDVGHQTSKVIETLTVVSNKMNFNFSNGSFVINLNGCSGL